MTSTEPRLAPVARTRRPSGSALQWLFSFGPAQRPRSAVGRWQESTGYFWVFVGCVVLVGSFVPPLLMPFCWLPLHETVGWRWRPEVGYNYMTLYGFDGAFRIGFMYLVLARAEVESFLFSSMMMRFLIIGPFVAVLAWLDVLFVATAAMILFIDLLTPIVALMIWEHTNYRERFRADGRDKRWWAVWLSLPQRDYQRTRISYVIEYESVLQSAYFLVCMTFPMIMYSAPGFFPPRYELGMLSATAGLLFVTVGLTPIVVMRGGGLYGGRGLWAARYVIWLRWLSLVSGAALCAVGLVPWRAWLTLHCVNLAGLCVLTVMYGREAGDDNDVPTTPTLVDERSA